MLPAIRFLELIVAGYSRKRILDFGCIGAVVNRGNHAAGKVLARAGFVFEVPFDHLQDLYLVA
ncbi:hypothetical protein [Mucilaginibacter sp. FT3.2]|uniref:hypothetical protein n=1 Tax=Mucilaginibacter sp. FT3.2 TaxID=2723090 RepID=UPI00161E8D45|nr:hypothetical protein [Mucilaginibacter sp. FT3.2]